jgi:uncharacterized protein YqeY
VDKITNKINQDLDNALRNQDQQTLSTLRLVKNSLDAAAKEKKDELSDQDVVKVLQKEAKQRRDSIASYKDAGRQDLADKEQQELSIIETYLPQQMSDEELSKLVEETVQQVKAAGMQDMGKVMGAVTKQTAGRADGSKVAEAVKAKLQTL